MSATSGGLTVTVSAGSAASALITPAAGVRAVYVYEEPLTSKSSADQEINITLTASESKSMILDTISCYELDRPILTQDATDLGIEPTSLASGLPILDGSYVSVGGVLDSLAANDSRGTLFSWAVGDADSSVTLTSATPANVLALAVPVLAPKLYRSDTTRSVYWRAYARMSTTGTGAIGVTTTQSGVSDSVAVTDTTFKWTAARSISVSCADVDEADGLQSSAFDLLNFSLAGSGTVPIIIQSFCVYL